MMNNAFRCCLHFCKVKTVKPQPRVPFHTTNSLDFINVNGRLNVTHYLQNASTQHADKLTSYGTNSSSRHSVCGCSQTQIVRHYATYGSYQSKRSAGSNVCYNCGQPGHIQSECPESREKGVRCYNCGQPGHIQSDCPESRKKGVTCYNCGQPGHIATECPEARNEKGLTCYNCGQPGHIQSECPEARAEKGVRCYNCGQPGHIQSECREPRKARAYQR